MREQLFEKELTRKQFLQVLGVVVASVLGFNNLLSMITRLSKTVDSSASKSSNGFGSSKFGV